MFLVRATAALVATAALAGPGETERNLAPWALYVTFWVGLVPASLLLGPVWRVVNPLRLLHRALRVLLPRSPGANFSAPVDVDTDGAFGHVDVALGRDGETIVSWWRRGANGGTELSARRIDAAGGLGEIQTIATSTASRPLDVPQMVRAGDLLVFAWTELEGDESTVRTATATL